eukprot:TRINITY_DN6076_c0_g2_i1.p1 TRINITY_DN6076_c0_g2~~TRINITY_DN6076_c0_g2_i1.p1  ORF type:complete len:1067 (+),score=247.35 TRINITY_DN6076_c0_g2_i1:113-3313(+)
MGCSNSTPAGGGGGGGAAKRQNGAATGPAKAKKVESAKVKIKEEAKAETPTEGNQADATPLKVEAAAAATPATSSSMSSSSDSTASSNHIKSDPRVLAVEPAPVQSQSDTLITSRSQRSDVGVRKSYHEALPVVPVLDLNLSKEIQQSEAKKEVVHGDEITQRDDEHTPPAAVEKMKFLRSPVGIKAATPSMSPTGMQEVSSTQVTATPAERLYSSEATPVGFFKQPPPVFEAVVEPPPMEQNDISNRMVVDSISIPPSVLVAADEVSASLSPEHNLERSTGDLSAPSHHMEQMTSYEGSPLPDNESSNHASPVSTQYTVEESQQPESRKSVSRPLERTEPLLLAVDGSPSRLSQACTEDYFFAASPAPGPASACSPLPGSEICSSMSMVGSEKQSAAGSPQNGLSPASMSMGAGTEKLSPSGSPQNGLSPAFSHVACTEDFNVAASPAPEDMMSTSPSAAICEDDEDEVPPTPAEIVPSPTISCSPLRNTESECETFPQAASQSPVASPQGRLSPTQVEKSLDTETAPPELASVCESPKPRQYSPDSEGAITRGSQTPSVEPKEDEANWLVNAGDSPPQRSPEELEAELKLVKEYSMQREHEEVDHFIETERSLLQENDTPKERTSFDDDVDSDNGEMLIPRSPPVPSPMPSVSPSTSPSSKLEPTLPSSEREMTSHTSGEPSVPDLTIADLKGLSAAEAAAELNERNSSTVTEISLSADCRGVVLDVIGAFTKVVSLDLSGCHFESVAQLQFFLNDKTSLRTLSLRNISFESTEAESDSYPAMTSVTELSMSSDFDDTECSLSQLVPVRLLLLFPSLTSLNLSESAFSDTDSLLKLLKLITSQRPVRNLLLQNLCFRSHDVGMSPVAIQKASGAMVASILKTCKNVKLLSVSGTELAANGLQELLRGMTRNAALNALDLSNCSIPGSAIPTLGMIVRKLPGLTKLKLSGNPLNQDGSSNLCAMLLITTIKVICLYDCNIQPQSLSKVINRQGTSLQDTPLDFVGSQIPAKLVLCVNSFTKSDTMKNWKKQPNRDPIATPRDASSAVLGSANAPINRLKGVIGCQ